MRGLSVLFLMVSCFLNLFVTQARAENENICFSFPALQGKAGNQTAMGLTVTNADSILAVDATVSYPADKLSVASVTKSTFSSDMTLVKNTDTAGVIRIAMAGATPLSGNGQLFEITFALTGAPGQSASINLTQITVNDVPHSACIQNGSILITPPYPTFSIGEPSSTLSMTGPITYTLTYTGANSITLSAADITLNKTGTANGTVAVSGTGATTRTVTISGITGDGTLGISIKAGTASDSSGGNAPAGGPSTTFAVDNTAPTLSIGSPSATVTKAGPLTYTLTYTGANSITLSGTDVTLNKTGTANGTVAVSGADNATRTVTISSISGDGTLGISIKAGTAIDSAGNNAAAAGPSTTFAVDNTAPTLSIGAPSASATKAGPITYTMTYTSANSITLSAADVTLNKTGTANGTVVVSGTDNATRTVTISSISGDGTLGISIKAGTATDSAGNSVAAAGPSTTFAVDNTAPTVSIGAPSASATKAGPITYTMTYTGANSITLSAADVTLNKTGTANGTVAVSGADNATRTVTLSNITGEGTLGISIKAGTATDSAGNSAGAADPSTTFTVDNTAPTVSIGAPSATVTKAGPITYTLTYTGANSITLAAADITMNKTGTANGTVAVSGTDNATRTVTISSISGDGTLGISIKAGTATDGVGNSAAAAGPSTTFAVDNTAPTVSISAPSATVTKAGPITYTLTYTGADSIILAAADITLNKTGTANGTVAVSGTDNATRTVTISSTTGDGTLGISVKAGTASDITGNGAAAAGPSTPFAVANTGPQLSISAPSASVAKAGPITYTVTYTSANTITLSTADITLNKTGTANGTAAVNGTGATTRTVTISGITGDGSLGISIKAGTASDSVGNGASAAGPSTTFIVDNTVPTLSIGAPSAGLSKSGPITYTVTYVGADSITLSPADITLNKTSTATGTAAVSGSGATTRTVTISGITGDGTLGISISAGSASDSAGNSTSAAGPSATFTVDNTAPTVSISAPSASATKAGPITYTLTYTGADTITLSAADIALNKTGTANGTAAVSESGATTRTVTISGITGDGTLGINIKAGTATDSAGNSAAAVGPSTTFTVVNTGPQASISGPSATGTKAGPITYTVTYTGADTITLSETDITFNSTGTAVGTVAVSGSGSATRTVTISSITGDGSLGINIKSGTATDSVGNSAPGVGPSTTFAVDNTAPTLSLGAPSANTTQIGPITYTLTYTGANSITLSATDVTLNKTGTANGTIAVSGADNTTRTVTISGITGDGTLGISIKEGTASDSVGNTVATAGPSSTFTVDNTPLTVSIGAPSASGTQAGPITYTVTYTGANTITLSATDIILNKTGATNGTAVVSGTGATTRTVTISGITGDGTLGISIKAGTATDSAGNSASAAGPSTTFAVDNTAPTVSIGAPSANGTKAGPITYTVTYAGASIITLSAMNITLNKTGTANGTVAVSGADNTTRTVTVSGITGDGALGISIIAGTASDSVGNSAGAAGPSASFTVDNTAPTVVSINRTLPAGPTTDAASVTYTVTFSEPVSTVTTTNFSVPVSGISNASISSVAGAAKTWTVVVSTGSGNGTLGLDMVNSAGVADVVSNAVASLPFVGQTYTITKVINHAPVASGGTLKTKQNKAANGTLQATDEDGDSLTYKIVRGAGMGAVVINNQSTGAFTYSPKSNAVGSDYFTFVANDGKLDSNEAVVTITILENHAPVADAQNVTTKQNVPVAVNLTGSDADGDSLTYIIVSQPSHGQLSGLAPSLTYTPNSDYSGTDSFTFKVNDGTVDSSLATVGLNVSANHRPVADAQSVTTNQNESLDIVLTGSDSDNDPLTYAIVSPPSHGQLSGVAPNLTYIPTRSYKGSDSFTFKVNDGTADSSIATVLVTVTLNHAPVADPQSVTTKQNKPVNVTLTGSDADNDTLTYAVVGKPSHGKLSGAAPNLVYAPDIDYSGPDGFTFKVNDGKLDSSPATVSLSVSMNHQPLADAQSVTTKQDTPVNMTLTGSDADTDPLTYSLVSQPSHGQLSGTAPNLTYTPAADYNGLDSFTFKVSDGSQDSKIAMVSLNVTLNHRPLADGQNVTTKQNVPVDIILTGSDADSDPLTYTVVKQPSHGKLSGLAPSLMYVPNSDYSGTDSFTFKVSDGTLDSNVATVSLSVSLNHRPVADAQSVTTRQNTSVGVTLTGSDADSDLLTFTLLSQPSHGSLSGQLPKLTYIPNSDYSGNDGFTFKASDGATDSNVATVSINVSLNHPPVADAQSITTKQNVPVSITLTGSDADSDPLRYIVVGRPAHGQLSGVAPELTFTPGKDYTGLDSFTFKVNDGAKDSSLATVLLSMSSNNKPVASGQNVTTKQGAPVSITLSGNDADGDPLTYVLVKQPSHGKLSGMASNQLYTPDSTYTGSDSFTFKVNDGAVDSDIATVWLSVSSNHAPEAYGQNVSTGQNVSVNITLTANDADGDSLTYILVSQPSHGKLSGSAPGLMYIPDSNYGGSDSFTFKVNDGAKDSNVATVSLTVNVNHPPVADAQSATTKQNVPLGIVLTGSDSDGDSLTYITVSQPAHGSLSGQAPNLTYIPASDYSGPDSFTFKVNDRVADSKAATVWLNVTLNHAPVADAQSAITEQNKPVSISLTGSDADSDPLAYAVVQQPSHGTLSGLAPNLTYNPANNYKGSDSFTFKVNDGTVDSKVATVSLTVSLNHPPAAYGQNVSTKQNMPVDITLTGDDVDGDSLTYTVVSQPSHGKLSDQAPSLRYTPNKNYGGSDSFTFKVNDGTADSTVATVWVSVSPNHPPTADDQRVTTEQNKPVNITLTGTDTDSDSLSYTVVGQPSHGSLSGQAPNLAYTPNSNYRGSDSFTFKVNDGIVDSSVATVSLSVTLNHAPVATGQDVTTRQGRPVSITLVGNDADADPLTYIIVKAPSKGSLSGQAPNLIYTPASTTYTGNDSFTFKVNDGTVDSNVATVGVSVSSNHAPVADAQSAVTRQNKPASITLTASDADSDSLAYVVVKQPSKGKLSGQAPELTYTPNNNYKGSDSFTFKVNDGMVDSNVATVSLTVGSNHAPLANTQSVTTKQNKSVSITLVGSDADSDLLTYAIVGQPSHGSLTGQLPALVYVPDSNYLGSDSFTFKVNDGVVDSNVATVSVTVGANHAPVANAKSVATKQGVPVSITLTGSDADADPLTYIVINQPAHGSFSGQLPNLTYTPAKNYSGTDSFTFKVNDGTVDSAAAKVSISITKTTANEPDQKADTSGAPIANAGPDQEVKAGEEVILNGSNSFEVNGGLVSYKWTQKSGTPAVLSSTGSARSTFVAPLVESTGESLVFKLEVVDRMGRKDSDQCIVNVTGLHKPPKADAGDEQTVEDGAKVVLDASRSSSEVGIASYSWTKINGKTVELSNSTGIRPGFIAPKASPEGECLVFVLEIRDNNGLVSEARTVVNVGCDNKPPQAKAGQDQKIMENDVVVLDGSDSADPEGRALTYRWTQLTGPPVELVDPMNARLTFIAPGAPTEERILTFRLTVSDPEGLRSQDSCAITVSADRSQKKWKKQ